jgi:hypothetical protein
MQIICGEFFVKELVILLFVKKATNVLMKDCKIILSVFIHDQFFVRQIMVLINVISHGYTSITRSKIVYHKKLLDLVTGNFLLRVITLLSDLSSVTELSGLLQSRLTEQVAFVQIRNLLCCVYL